MEIHPIVDAVASLYGMELTAKTIREVTFGAKVRGYDPAEVDEFIAAVAEGVDELQERLRRAIDRATRAEQAATSTSNVAVAVEAPVATTTAPSTPEISKVWERAVAAAEEAIAEAKVTAQQMLDDAKREADAKVGGAYAEAKRVSDEAQGQLRAQITQLEGARDQLQSDVTRLAEYLEEERAKVRSVLTRALAALDDDSTVAAPLPEVEPIDVPEPAPIVSEAAATALSEDSNGASDDEDRTGSSNDAGNADKSAESPADSSAASWSGAALQEAPSVVEQAGYGESAWSAPHNPWVEEQRGRESGDAGHDTNGGDQSPPAGGSQPSTSEHDQDPFLAELRRAVQDDAPLGPRDDADERNPIDSLYADDDDDDKKGFFPWKK